METQTSVLDEQIKKIESDIIDIKLEIADLFISGRKFTSVESMSNPKNISEVLSITTKMHDSLTSFDINKGKLETLLLCRTQLENNKAIA